MFPLHGRVIIRIRNLPYKGQVMFPIWKNSKFVARGMIVVAGICLVAALASFFYVRHFLASAKHTKGTIVQMIERNDSFFPVFTFTDESGVAHKVFSSYGRSPPNHQVHDEVAVLYQADTPDSAWIDEGFMNWIIPLALGIAGVLNTVIGIVLWCRPRTAP